MVTPGQVVNCVHRVHRLQELVRQAEGDGHPAPDHHLLVLMLRQLRQRERLLMAQLTPEQRLEVQQEVERQRAQR